ncbi:venom peptide BmKAPI-like [Achroia grisella]|uniref:venom peptide BmKAPI-like n=1 Tax=Achroia grisella TaxID=688607 RepID=UPI0027D2220E|nr:venom peptide BmKAPI-like [Achroia grisella]
MSSYVFCICLFSVIANVVYLSPIDENKTFECAANERYIKCYHEICFRTCEHLENPFPCAAVSSDCYAPACLCLEGQLRDNNGKCIMSDQCY